MLFGNLEALILRFYFNSDTQKQADEAAKLVKVTYKDCKPPILTFEQAIEAKSFPPPVPPPWSMLFTDINVGDAEGMVLCLYHAY